MTDTDTDSDDDADTGDNRSLDDFKTIPLKTGTLVPPWVTQLPQKSTITDGYVLEMETGDLPLKEKTLEPGTEVQVINYQGEIAVREWESVERKREHRRQRNRTQKKATERARARTDRLQRNERREFWARYDVPIPFKVNTNARIGQLRKGSTGTGRTMTHFLTEEAFQQGRLNRDIHDHLCGDKGKRWHYGIETKEVITDPGEETPLITCQTCRDRMQRWKTPADDSTTDS